MNVLCWAVNFSLSRIVCVAFPDGLTVFFAVVGAKEVAREEQNKDDLSSATPSFCS
jgi:hypothetical protein